jgi:Family of unknown function (DUF6263)
MKQTFFLPSLLKAYSASFCLALLSAVNAQAAQTWELKSDTQATVRVESRIEVKGDLKLINSVETKAEDVNSKEKQVVTKLPLEVTAQLRFAERPVVTNDASLISLAVRDYEIAQADMKVGKGTIKNELAKEHRLIVVEQHQETHALFSPEDSLSRDEADLIDGNADSSLFPALLPSKAVAIGDSWTPSNEVLAQLMRWDIVTQSDVTLKLNRVENNVAIIDVAGKLSGGKEGITSELTLEGKLNFDLEAKICSWLALVVKENRTASQGTPGFETSSRIRVSITKSPLSERLAELDLTTLKLKSDAATQLLRYRSAAAGFEFVYEPAWRVVTDQRDLTVLRYLQRGDVLAQCNVSSLAPLNKGEQLTLEGFQAHLRQSLKDSLGEFVEGGEQLNESGVRVLRVVATGTIAEVPLQWVFYHLSDDQAHRVSIAITVNAEHAERFGRAEETLINSFYFSPTEAATATEQASTAKPAKLK